jgi:ABC-type arginine transport system ATPase subunit
MRRNWVQIKPIDKMKKNTKNVFKQVQLWIKDNVYGNWITHVNTSWTLIQDTALTKFRTEIDMKLNELRIDQFNEKFLEKWWPALASLLR